MFRLRAKASALSPARLCIRIVDATSRVCRRSAFACCSARGATEGSGQAILTEMRRTSYFLSVPPSTGGSVNQSPSRKNSRRESEALPTSADAIIPPGRRPSTPRRARARSLAVEDKLLSTGVGRDGLKTSETLKRGGGGKEGGRPAHGPRAAGAPSHHRAAQRHAA